MTPDELSERLLGFAVASLRVVKTIKKAPNGGNVARQLERCGPAAGANYEEARGAESRADFVHKVSVAAKEMRESRYWLRIASEVGLAPETDLAPVVLESNELTAILMRSAKTARANRSR